MQATDGASPAALNLAFVALADLCLSRGRTNLSTETPAGECVAIPIDTTWNAWLNPHGEESLTEEGGVPVPPFSAYVTYNGWPWGLFDSFGGFHGEHPREGAGNLETFMAAVLAAASSPDA